MVFRFSVVTACKTNNIKTRDKLVITGNGDLDMNISNEPLDIVGKKRSVKGST